MKPIRTFPEILEQDYPLTHKSLYENSDLKSVLQAHEDFLKQPVECTHPKEALAYWNNEVFCVRCKKVINP